MADTWTAVLKPDEVAEALADAVGMVAEQAAAKRERDLQPEPVSR